MVIKESYFKSVSGLSDIYLKCWLPDDTANVKAIFQMAHGMAEHTGRYDWFAEKLTEAGYAVYMNDHLGHGKSVSDDKMLGYFGKKNGWATLVKDQRQITEIARKEFPGVPVVVFGHSMGSFICRAYTGRYHDVDAAVYCGTGGPNPAAGMGIAVADSVAAVKGVMHRSKLIDKMAFGAYNKRFEGRTAFDWLTRDTEIVDKYIADNYCGFMFTAAGYKDLFSVLSHVSDKKWYGNVPTKMPILLVAGQEDPVGSYGKGVQTVYENLIKTGHNAQIKLFEGCRHEILNEINRDEVAKYIIDFADKAIRK